MARKDKSAIVSGAGWIAGFSDKLIRGLHERGVSDEQIHSLVTDAGEVPVGVVVDVLVEQCFKKFARDMSKEGWTLLEDTREPWPISVADLELVPFLKEGEDYIGGEELVRRSGEELHANLGQRHAEYLLENQDEIPEELRKFVLVFPGTIWRGRYDNRYVPYLVWSGGQWRLSFGWLENDFVFSCRLLRPRK